MIFSIRHDNIPSSIRGLLMSLRNILRENTNPTYRMDHSEKSNIQMVSFEKNYKRYEYWFVTWSLQSFIMLPRDKKSHREVPLIFTSDIFENVNQILKEVNHDFNFMNIFCFGTKSFLSSQHVDDMLQDVHISGEYLLAYSANVKKSNDDISFLMDVKILFNINKGKLEVSERFYAYDYSNTDNYGKPSRKTIIEDPYWDSFKRKFMTIYAATKIEKNVNELLFQDSAVAQMINL